MAITVRVTEEQENQIEILKRSVNEKSSSKALLAAAKMVPELKDELWKRRERISLLEHELLAIKSLIRESHETKEQLLFMANKDLNIESDYE